MRWNKLGLVRGSGSDVAWAEHSALQPSPHIREDHVRVYCGMRDGAGRSRVGWVDVDRDDPTRVVGLSEQPALDLGSPDAFDAAGVVPCAVAEAEGTLRLYYAGYGPPRSDSERFRVFSGLAVSADGGNTFARNGARSILEAGPGEELFRVIHSIRQEGGRWRAWYGAGGHFVPGRSKLLPVYDIRYFESEDGIAFPSSGRVVIPLRGEEHRVGRPYVVSRPGGGYRMFFGAGTEATVYRLAYADSEDGLDWTRHDERVGIQVSANGWDSKMQAYPAVVNLPAGTFMFYNGNDYGRAGFGVARLVEE